MRFVRLNGSTLKTVLFATINIILLQVNQIMFMGNAGFVVIVWFERVVWDLWVIVCMVYG